MSRTIHSREDVEVDEWVRESDCPVCGPDASTAVAGAVRPTVWRCQEDGCGVSWTRSVFKKVGGGRRAR